LASVRPAVYTYTAPNTVDGVAYLYAQARGVILKSQLVNDAAADLVMAVDEALSNAHRHGQVNEGPVELKVIWLQCGIAEMGSTLHFCPTLVSLRTC
jgi:anti-sigma regulatory factor (Ser/Thr protein kinase)